jgi:hypothetical protein
MIEHHSISFGHRIQPTDRISAPFRPPTACRTLIATPNGSFSSSLVAHL